MLHLVDAPHLLHEQLRIRSDVQAVMAIAPGPFERRDQGAVFGHVVRGDAHRLAELFDQGAIGLDPDAESCRPGIAAGAAVDIRDDQGEVTAGSCGTDTLGPCVTELFAGRWRAWLTRPPARSRECADSCRIA